MHFTLVPPVTVVTLASACVGGVGVPALSVEDHPGGRGHGVHRGAPAAAALLAARVGRQGHLHSDNTERCTHSSAQDNGRNTTDVTAFLLHNWFVTSSAVFKRLFSCKQISHMVRKLVKLFGNKGVESICSF